MGYYGFYTMIERKTFVSLAASWFSRNYPDSARGIQDGNLLPERQAPLAERLA